MNFLDMLERYKPASEQERVYRDNTIQFLYLHRKEAFKRAHYRGHFTVSFLLLNKDKTKLLLIRQPGELQWSAPTFFVNNQRDLMGFAQESACTLTATSAIEPAVPAVFDVHVEKNVAPADSFYETKRHMISFLLRTTEEEAPCSGNRIYYELRWFPLNEPIPSGDPRLTNLVQKCRTLVGCVLPARKAQKKESAPTPASRKHIPLPKDAFPDNQEPSA